eukprot:gene3549-7064_t
MGENILFPTNNLCRPEATEEIQTKNQLLPPIQQAMLPEQCQIIPTNSPVVVGVTSALMDDEQELPKKSWHDLEEHKRIRDTMIQCVAHLIQQRRPNASEGWIEKLPEVARRVEERLYAKANSLEEYNDPYTLVDRLHTLVFALVAETTLKVQTMRQENRNEIYNDDDDNENGSDNYSSENSLKIKPIPSKRLKRLRTGNQVSSQGCSRVFIVKVLRKVSEFVKGKFLPNIFTFKKEVVTTWLEQAKEDCSCASSYAAEEVYYGGPPFMSQDPSTHWSDPNQLYTWWKNNVERRSKFRILQDDMGYVGEDSRRSARARWCEMVVALSEVIRSSSGSSAATRNINDEGGGGGGYIDSTATSSSSVAWNPDNNDNNDPDPDPGAAISPDRDRDRDLSSDSEHSEDEEEEEYRVHPKSLLSSPSHVSRRGSMPVVRSNTANIFPFPLQLFDLLAAVKGDTNAPIRWQDHGIMFEVTDAADFETSLLPAYFKTKLFSVFQQFLGSYGFHQVHWENKSQSVIFVYHHSQFMRGHRELAAQICRVLTVNDNNNTDKSRQSKSKSSSRKLKDTKSNSKQNKGPTTTSGRRRRVPDKEEKGGNKRPNKRHRTDPKEGEDEDDNSNNNNKNIKISTSKSAAVKHDLLHHLRGDDAMSDITSFDTATATRALQPLHRQAAQSLSSILDKYSSSDVETVDLTNAVSRRIFFDFTKNEQPQRGSNTNGPSHFQATTRGSGDGDGDGDNGGGGIIDNGASGEGKKCSRVGTKFQAHVPPLYTSTASLLSPVDTDTPFYSDGRRSPVTADVTGETDANANTHTGNVDDVDALCVGDVVLVLVQVAMGEATDRDNEDDRGEDQDRDVKADGESVDTENQLLPLQDIPSQSRRRSGINVLSSYRLAVIVGHRHHHRHFHGEKDSNSDTVGGVSTVGSSTDDGRLLIKTELPDEIVVVTVFDGCQEYEVPLSVCTPFIWSYSHADGDPKNPNDSITMSGAEMGHTVRVQTRSNRDLQWSLSEVQRFCDGIRRYRDDLRKIHPHLSNTRTYRETVDFFQRVYPHGRCGGARRLLRLFRRAQSVGSKSPTATTATRASTTARPNSPGTADEDEAVNTDGDGDGDRDSHDEGSLPSEMDDNTVLSQRNGSKHSVTKEKLLGGNDSRRRISELQCDPTYDGSQSQSQQPESFPLSNNTNTNIDVNAVVDLVSAPTRAGTGSSLRSTRRSSRDKAAAAAAVAVVILGKNSNSELELPINRFAPFNRPPLPPQLQSEPGPESSGPMGSSGRTRRSMRTTISEDSSNGNSQGTCDTAATATTTSSSSSPSSSSLLYCVCKTEEEGRYIACSNAGKGCLCNGWVHAECVGKQALSDSALRALDNSYMCPPCKTREKEQQKQKLKPGKSNRTTTAVDKSSSSSTDRNESTSVKTTVMITKAANISDGLDEVSTGRRSQRARKPTRYDDDDH